MVDNIACQTSYSSTIDSNIGVIRVPLPEIAKVVLVISTPLFTVS